MLTIRHLAHHLAQDRVGDLALFLNKDVQGLRNKLNFNSDSAHLYVQEFEQIADFTDSNFTVANYFAAKCNAVVVQLPNVNTMGDMALLDGFLAVMREIGELSAEFQKAYADGDINEKEFDRIVIEISETVAKLLAWQASIKQVVR